MCQFAFCWWDRLFLWFMLVSTTSTSLSLSLSLSVCLSVSLSLSLSLSLYSLFSLPLSLSLLSLSLSFFRNTAGVTLLSSLIWDQKTELRINKTFRILPQLSFFPFLPLQTVVESFNGEQLQANADHKAKNITDHCLKHSCGKRKAVWSSAHLVYL